MFWISKERGKLMIGPKRREDIARLFRQAVLRFDFEQGFPLAIHRSYSRAPLSPYFFDFDRLPSFQRVLDEVTDCCAHVVADANTQFDLICDVPTAATPLTTLTAQKLHKPMLRPRFRYPEGSLNGVWQPGGRVLICDDVRTTGGSKKRVIELLRRNDLLPVLVLVAIDLGVELGDPIGDVPVLSLFDGPWLFEFCYRWGEITFEQFRACRSYPAELAAYLKAQGEG